MLYETINDFLIHGNGPLGFQSVESVNQEAVSLLTAYTEILSEQKRQQTNLVTFKSNIVALQNTMAAAGVDAQVDAFRHRNLALKLTTMAQAVERLRDLQIPIDAGYTKHIEAEKNASESDIQNATNIVLDTSTSSQGDKERQRQALRSIPALVLDVVVSFPLGGVSLSSIPKKSRIMTLLREETVSKLKESIRHQFTIQFESMLTHSGDNLDASSAKATDELGTPNAIRTQMWHSFLVASREWLLAYCMLAILPVVLSETPQAVQDAYRHAVDEMLAPLWGRFRFHLRQSTGATTVGEGGSKRQVLWTFHYCRSFVQLLVDLCRQITTAPSISSDPTQGVSFDGAVCMERVLLALPLVAGQQVRTDVHTCRLSLQKFLINKCIHFFQAHLAEVLVATSQTTQNIQEIKMSHRLNRSPQEAFVLQLVECSLSLDYDLSRIMLATEGQKFIEKDDDQNSIAYEDSDKSLVLTHSCIEVFCATRVIYMVWIRNDTEFVLENVRNILSLHDKLHYSDSPNMRGGRNSVSHSASPFCIIFSNAFDEKTPLFEKSETTRKAGFPTKVSNFFCYKGPYALMCLFQLTTQRYCAIPGTCGAPLQLLFSTFILEPLLHLILSLLILRLRSNRALCDLYNGVLPADMLHHSLFNENSTKLRTNPNGRLTGKGSASSEENPSDAIPTLQYAHCPYASQVSQELSNFFNCIDYLELALANCGESVRSLCCGGTIDAYQDSSPSIEEDSSGTSYERAWSEIHAWLPSDCIASDSTEVICSASSTAQHELLKQLIGKAIPSYDENSIASAMREPSRRIHLSTSDSACYATLGGSIDFCRAQIITLAHVLRRNEAKAKLKLGV
jgi:hypothetical protein